jgi:glycosyltransferase involved in cell wall biosynthesis
MLRTHDRQPCMKPTARDCARCFAGISADAFFLRQRYIQSQFALVDRFIAPSEFLRDRYVDWGLDADRILVEPCGRVDTTPLCDPCADRPRHTFGFFGQLTPFKGADVLLEAMQLLAARNSPARLRLHGANLDRQRPVFRQKLQAFLDAAGQNVAQVGSYRRDQVPKLMADVDWVVVPSIWWENAPLVIQEAFHHGRPVICSDIGGMAEKVAHNVDGLHFRAGSASSLADAMERALSTPGLWNRLRTGIQPVHSMADHLAFLESLYDELLAARSPSGVLEGSVR